jgi:hypothetical protein
MSGEDKVLGLTAGVTTVKSLEDNLHSYTNDASAVGVGDVVYQDGSVDDKVAISASSTASSNPPIGVVSEVVDTTNCIVCHSGGIVTGLSGLTRGAKYWLSDVGTTGNTLTSTQPSTDAYFVGVALSATSLLVLTFPLNLEELTPMTSDTSPTTIQTATAFGTSGSKVETDSISVSDFREIDFSFTVSNLGTGPITEIRAQVLYSLLASPGTYAASPQDWNFLLAESITGGVATVDNYTVSLDASTYLASLPASFAIRAPVSGQHMLVLIWAETGTPTSSVFAGRALRRI